MHGRAHVVDEAGAGERFRAQAAADMVRSFDHGHPPPGPGKRDRGDEPVRPGADDERIGAGRWWVHRPQCRIRVGGHPGGCRPRDGSARTRYRCGWAPSIPLRPARSVRGRPNSIGGCHAHRVVCDHTLVDSVRSGHGGQQRRLRDRLHALRRPAARCDRRSRHTPGDGPVPVREPARGLDRGGERARDRRRVRRRRRDGFHDHSARPEGRDLRRGRASRTS